MIIKIKKIHPDAIIPRYAHEGDAGMDIFSAENIIIKPNERIACKTGISMHIPENHVGLIWDKSGIALKNGVTTLGGVIDSGYRGELQIVMINLSKENYNIKEGNKIAQMLIQKIENPKIQEVEELDETSRGDGGFGSTGLR